MADCAAQCARHASPATSTPLLQALEETATSYLQPNAFFVSWHGVLTLAYSGFTPALLDAKRRISAAHRALPPESPGSKWPKTTLGCLKDTATLSREQFDSLNALCKEASAAAFGAAGTPIKIAVDSAVVVIYENRCLERLITLQAVPFDGGVDDEGPAAEEQERVRLIVKEADEAGYYNLATKEGNRASHYVGPALGATLMHPLSMALARVESPRGQAEVHRPRRGLQERGVQELQDRRRLLEAVQEFRTRVDAALPGLFCWFAEPSLHVTLRALIL